MWRGGKQFGEFVQATEFAEKGLYRGSVHRESEVRALLERVKAGNVVLSNGMDRRNRARRAWVAAVQADRVVLRHENVDAVRQGLVYLTFELGDSAYSLAALPLGTGSGQTLSIEMPESVHELERRSKGRIVPPGDYGTAVLVQRDKGAPISGRVLDSSVGGLGLEVEASRVSAVDSRVTVQFLDGPRAGSREDCVVRHEHPVSATGWTKIGVSLGAGDPLPVRKQSEILEQDVPQRAWRRIEFAGRTVQAGQKRVLRNIGIRSTVPTIEIVEYENEQAQPIKAIVDRAINTIGGPVVVIPPAWGRTKETLLPLAQTIVQTFRAAGRPMTVIRFDGTQRRGESYVDPECRNAGDEALHFTYSQAARDIHASVRFAQQDSSIQASEVVLVTFSLAAIDGRLALASDTSGSIAGWVAAVGMADVQSAMRSVSGGIDFLKGAESGLKFGVHELGGVRVDIDRAAADVMKEDIGTIEAARQDMRGVRQPVTWIHGEYDGWTTRKHIQDMLSGGDTSNRKLIEIPSGHQLRTSRQALETFQLIAQEVSEMASGAKLSPRIPNLGEMEARSRLERARVPKKAVDIPTFWHDYLIGRDDTVGMELLTSTAVYKRFMESQMASLSGLPLDGRILDLGCGTGDFALSALEAGVMEKSRLCCVDFVPEALRRARDRFSERSFGHGVAAPAFALLDAESPSGLPFRSGSFDAIVASLLVSYVSSPEDLLREMYRVVRPGGKVILSSPCRDADLSSLYRSMLDDLTPEKVDESFAGRIARDTFDVAQRNYLNEAARLLDLEEAGRFRFWDSEDLADIVSSAGFVDAESSSSLGDPPQAIIVSAQRP